MKEEIKKIIEKAIGTNVDFSVEVSDNQTHGDYSSNVALVLAKKLGKNPHQVAEDIKQKVNSDLFSKIEIAGPGFINFFIADKFFIDNLKKVNKNYGKDSHLENQKIIIDYTDPNPFKEFHIGHLMSNAIGESLSRIFEFQGAKVKRVCYQGDVGMHVAKAIWGKIENEKLSWGQAYAYGAQMYDEDSEAKTEIVELNKKIYQRSDKNVNQLYDQGKKDSLKHFDKIYKKLGTKFNWLIFESQTGPIGQKIVEKGLEDGVFEKGEKGAVIFKGEEQGLHTRVFINSEGLPTYEAKDLGLAEIKYQKYKYDKSIIVTGNEVNEYFKVVKSAMAQVLPELAKKTEHIGHGMMRLPEGKMSSRTGKVITGESLIEKIEELARQKIASREASKKPAFAVSYGEAREIIENVAIGAIKYSVLKQKIGHDIIFDFDHSISFDGDSGPYLQYSYARAQSVLRKAKIEGIKPNFKKSPLKITQLEKSVSHFSEVILEVQNKLEPHILVLYLTELAGIFNSYYAENKIVDKKDEFSQYKVALTKAFTVVMKNGLWMLGINAPEKM